MSAHPTCQRCKGCLYGPSACDIDHDPCLCAHPDVRALAIVVVGVLSAVALSLGMAAGVMQ